MVFPAPENFWPLLLRWTEADHRPAPNDNRRSGSVGVVVVPTLGNIRLGDPILPSELIDFEFQRALGARGLYLGPAEDGQRAALSPATATGTPVVLAVVARHLLASPPPTDCTGHAPSPMSHPRQRRRPPARLERSGPCVLLRVPGDHGGPIRDREMRRQDQPLVDKFSL